MFLASLETETQKPDFGEQAEASTKNYFEAIEAASRDQRYFSMTGGRVGLGPSRLEVGDVVCVFYSHYPLYVLRFKDEVAEAKLIGDAYVHGLMRIEDILEFQGKKG
jgi:hypothetical protein